MIEASRIEGSFIKVPCLRRVVDKNNKKILGIVEISKD